LKPPASQHTEEGQQKKACGSLKKERFIPDNPCSPSYSLSASLTMPNANTFSLEGFLQK